MQTLSDQISQALAENIAPVLQMSRTHASRSHMPSPLGLTPPTGMHATRTTVP